MDLKEFNSLKDMLLKRDQKNNQLIGAKKAILESLKEEYGLKSIEEAEKELKKIKKDYSEIEEEIEELTNDLLKDLKKEGILEDGED
jgi:hypothetical protein